jgi:hypothetical protein
MLREQPDSFATPSTGDAHIYENPSADKFGPPRSPSEPTSDRRLWRRLIRATCVIGIYTAAHSLQVSFRGRGWLTIAAIAVFGSGVLDIIEHRIGNDEHEDNDSYRPPTNITR